jgi:hypothetical protein
VSFFTRYLPYKLIVKLMLFIPLSRDGLKRSALVALIDRQLHLWPFAGTKGKFVWSKTTIAKMREVLLTASHGFTKTVTVQIPTAPDKSHSPTPQDEGVSTQPADFSDMEFEARCGDGSMNLMDGMHDFGFPVSAIN